MEFSIFDFRLPIIETQNAKPHGKNFRFSILKTEG